MTGINPSWTSPACASVLCWTTAASQDTLNRDGNCKPIGVHTHQLSSQHALRYIQYALRLWVKKNQKWFVSQFLFLKGWQALAISLGIKFISGHAQYSSWLAFVTFAQSMTMPCRLHEQIILAYQTNIVQRDASFCDEKRWSRMDILSGISLKLENFLQTVSWLQVVDLHWLWAHVFSSGSGSRNLLNQAKCTALFAKLSCVQILPCLEWNDNSFLFVEAYVGLSCCT